MYDNGRTLESLALEVDRQNSSKADYLADTRTLKLSPISVSEGVFETKLDIDLGETVKHLNVTKHAHRQMGERLKIPAKYYDRMLQNAPQLLAENVNHWFQNKPEPRMIRVLDDNARAFLSNSYRPLDNYDLSNVVLPIIGEMEDMIIVSCEITDRRLYIKALFPRIEREIKRGDIVQSGIIVSNSEIGSGSLQVAPLVFHCICSNGMISQDAFKKYHVGGATEVEGAMELYRDETRQADDKATWMKVEDTVRATIEESKFEGIVRRLQESTGDKITMDPEKAVERITTKFNLSDNEQGGVLRHLIDGGDLSRYGMVQAVTRTSQDVTTYDRATELERLGGKVLELPQMDWNALAKAA